VSLPKLSGKEYYILELLISRGETFALQLVDTEPTRIPRGTVYVTLQRMSRKGFVTSRQVADSAGGAPRRMYRPTGLGYRLYTALRREIAGG
jgi:PadR family transcriptional regulator PadR